MTTPTDTLSIDDVEFETMEDDPAWSFRAGERDGNHEVQGRHDFCGAVFSVSLSVGEYERITRRTPEALDGIIGEMVDTIIDKHRPCPVMAGRVRQITTG